MSDRVLPAAPTARVPDATFADTVSFRAAALDDVAVLEALINEAYLRESHVIPGPRISAAELRTQMAASHSRIWLAVAGGVVIGTVRVRLLDDGAWFGLLATHVAHQGRGLASLLVGEAERVALGEGRTVMRLECARELGMPPYYASLGYEVESTEADVYFTSPGPPPRRKGPITRVVMRKALA
jgi:predicted N-acetyltransferase YhbS